MKWIAKALLEFDILPSIYIDGPGIMRSMLKLMQNFQSESQEATQAERLKYGQACAILL